MDEYVSSNNGKKGTSKKFLIFIITALLVVGGSVAAFVFLNMSDKQKYFLAEKNSIEAVTEQMENRFEPELEWQEKVQENPTETTLELAGTFNDPSASLNAFGPAQIINNSTVTINNAIDRKEKKMATKISGEFGGIKIEGLNVYLTSKKLLVELPFLQELLQIKEGDVGKLLHEIDPTIYTGEEKVDFNTFFNNTKLLSEEDAEYLKKEYLEMIYNNLPEDAFKATNESVKVNGESVDAEKITFHLTEKQFKDLLVTTMEKMKDDKRLKEIIREQLAVSSLGAGVSSSNLSPSLQNDIDKMVEEFETGLEEGIKALETFQIPDGFTSTIWVNDDLIVKRDFSITMGPSEDQLITLKINGTQMLGETNQTFNYEFASVENDQESTMTISGDLSWKDNKAEDTIKLVTGDGEFTYEGSSTLTDGKRDFERVFTLKTGQDQGSLHWTGNATYKEDSMNSENTLDLQVPGMPENMVSLEIGKEAKLIKQVEVPEDPEVKDIGGMSVNEIAQYFQMEVAPQFQQWLMGVMGGNLNGF